MTSIMIDGKKINARTVPDVRTETQKRYRVGKLQAYAQKFHSQRTEKAYREFNEAIKGIQGTRDDALAAEDARFDAEMKRHTKAVVGIETAFITNPTLVAAKKVMNEKIEAETDLYYQIVPKARGDYLPGSGPPRAKFYHLLP